MTGVRRKLWRVRVKRASGWAAAAMLALVLGITLWSWEPQPAAVISKIGASEKGIALQLGERFASGDILQFANGLVELDLPGRGRMIVEGPAKLVFVSATHADLASGRVLMRVTEKGRGYRLTTPKGTIVDLGTEFGVVVNEATQTVETHVLEGEVKAVVNELAEPIFLKKDQALRQSGSINRQIPADQGQFYASLPPTHQRDLKMIHWSLEPGANDILPPHTKNMTQPADLKQRGNLSLTDGPFGQALDFDGKGSYAETNYRGVGGDHPRTVAFWVNVPRDFKVSQGYAMVSWGEFKNEKPGAVWQVSVNPTLQDGPLGRLRVGVHGGKAIGSTDLRDGGWHHVAVVLYPASQPSFGQHVQLFVDGNLELISNRVLGTIDTEVEESTHGVWLGRDVNTTKGQDGFFKGMIDEVYIFNAALTQEEIRRLKERNEPPE